MPVTLISDAMQRIANLMKKLGDRGYMFLMLITNPDDTAELTALATMVANRRGHADPLVVRSNDATATRPNHEGRGIVIMNAERLALPKDRSEMSILADDFVRWSKEKPPRTLIANFANRNACDETVATWPAEIKERFARKPLEWPSLRQREADLPGIMENICAQFTSRDDSVHAELAKDAKILLTQEVMHRKEKGMSVATLRRRIRGGFDVMLRCKAPEITAQHLRLAVNPRERGAYLASVAAFTT
jgi:hypothetical protein